MPIDDPRKATADSFEATAATLRDEADCLPNERLSQFAHATAEHLGKAADYVRTHDVRRMMEDIERVVKDNPGPSLLLAAIAGFVAGRAIARD